MARLSIGKRGETVLSPLFGMLCDQRRYRLEAKERVVGDQRYRKGKLTFATICEMTHHMLRGTAILIRLTSLRRHVYTLASPDNNVGQGYLVERRAACDHPRQRNFDVGLPLSQEPQSREAHIHPFAIYQRRALLTSCVRGYATFSFFFFLQSDDEPAGYYDHAAGEDDMVERKSGRK